MKKLTRSRESSIGGVCGGIANYFNIDPTLVRLLFAGLIFTPFPIIITYIVGWMVIPKEVPMSFN